ncbi:hypothetical protein JJB11_17720 [Ramlibacter ginsenosidimutans]|uniref:Uncharacterized protein n=1 Tax=Ramlibacter ginsenosidimutans TaxID=502333 RepID=A0A934WNQ8_9BURK|nr:hypothetical protein [Ramlibacter ginsenosidimutans]MBK6007941.1 hypothetical protein [Ramlibacter ginsenosidimutans]
MIPLESGVVALSLAQREEISQSFLELRRDRLCCLEVSVVVGFAAENEGAQVERDRLDEGAR